MKSVITGIIAATILATATAFVMDTKMQEGVDVRFATTGVRL